MSARSGIIIIGETEYDVPASFKLGEARAIKQISGADVAEIAERAQRGDADVIAALIYVVLKRVDPSTTIEKVDEIEFAEIRFPKQDEPEPETPTGAAESAA